MEFDVDQVAERAVGAKMIMVKAFKSEA